jgi:hypothetical protein
MPGQSLPVAPDADDFRALARSSPWRFTTLHLTHERQADDASHDDTLVVEAWLDRRKQRVTVRSAHGIEVAAGAPYSVSDLRVVGGGVATDVHTPSPTPVVRPDGLVERRPEDYHLEHGDPMWRDYVWTAMLDPAELSHGVGVSDVRATIVRGRAAWAATCRPLVGEGEDWVGGYDPRCGCCPLLDSRASRLIEYGPDDPVRLRHDLPTAYVVHLDVQTGIVVDIAPLDGSGGTTLTNEIHAVDQPLDAPAA